MKALELLLTNLQKLDDWNLHVDILEIISYPMQNVAKVTVGRNDVKYTFVFDEEEGEGRYKYHVTNTVNLDDVATVRIWNDSPGNMHALAYIFRKEQFV